MEIVLRDKKAELCIDYDDQSVGFTMLDKNKNQYDFVISITEWEQLKEYIDFLIKNDLKNGPPPKPLNLQRAKNDV